MNIKKVLYYAAHRAIGSYVGSLYEQILKEDMQRLPQCTTENSLIDLLNHCKSNVPYYAEIISQMDKSYERDPITYLEELPILTKDIIRKNLAQLTSTDLPKRKWFYNTSGGSTGEPIKLIQDRQFSDRQSAVQMLSFQWAGRSFGDSAVRVWGSERDILQGSMGLKMIVLSKLTNDAYFNAFRMTSEEMRDILKVLSINPPKLIIAYAQAIYELARFAERENITVAPQSAILTSAGTLYPFMRNKLEDVFKCKIFNRYGSREVGDIACECEVHENMHVFSWTNYVEVVDNSGHIVPAGVEGDIVVTCLTNYAMPLIRYFIGDRGVLSPRRECSCGRKGQILEKILGRNVDSFRKKDGTLVDGEYFTHILYFRDWVRKFQIIQKTHTSIVFKIVRINHDYNERELDEIIEKTKFVMGQDCIVTFEFSDDIAPSSSGKYRYTVSEVRGV